MDIGFHNIDTSLQRYRLRIDGIEIGPVLTWGQCENACYWLRKYIELDAENENQRGNNYE